MEHRISYCKEFAFEDFLYTLPSKVKGDLLLFLYFDAIKLIPFLQNRSEHFYLTYLNLLKPHKFLKCTEIIKEGTKSEEVFFILSGEVFS